MTTLTVVPTAPTTRLTAAAPAPAGPAALLAALSPWDAVAPREVTPLVEVAQPAPDAEELAVRLLDLVEGLVGADLLPTDRYEVILDVVAHVHGVATGAAGVAEAQRAGAVIEARRVLVGYAHHLNVHRFVLGGEPTLADFALWQAVTALPVRFGDAAAADVLRDLTSLRRWAGTLAASFPAAVDAVGEQVVSRAA